MVNTAPTIAHAGVRGGIKALASKCRAGLQAKCRRFWTALVKLWKSGYEADTSSQSSQSAPPTPPPNPSPSHPTNLAKKRLGRHTALSLLANSGVDSWTDYPLSTSPRLGKGEIQDVLWQFGNARRVRKEVGFALEFRKAGRVRGRVELGEWTWEGALSGKSE